MANARAIIDNDIDTLNEKLKDKDGNPVKLTFDTITKSNLWMVISKFELSKEFLDKFGRKINWNIYLTNNELSHALFKKYYKSGFITSANSHFLVDKGLYTQELIDEIIK